MKGIDNMTNEELVTEIQQGINVKKNLQELYQQNTGIINMIIKPYMYYSEYDDLMQEAYFGLHKATELYNPNEEVPFISFAVHWIKNAVSRYAMNTGHTKRIPVNMLALISKYKKFITDYEGRYHKYPTHKEICRGIGISERKLNSLMKAEHEMNCYSMDEALPGADDRNVTRGDNIPSDIDIETDVIERFTRKANETELWDIVSNLEERKCEVLTDRYRNSMSLEECGNRLNISGERVRQIEKKACGILKRMSTVKRIALEYGYDSSNAYKWGVGRFRNTFTSSTEHNAIKHLTLQEEYQNLNSEYQSLHR